MTSNSRRCCSSTNTGGPQVRKAGKRTARGKRHLRQARSTSADSFDLAHETRRSLSISVIQLFDTVNLVRRRLGAPSKDTSIPVTLLLNKVRDPHLNQTGPLRRMSSNPLTISLRQCMLTTIRSSAGTRVHVLQLNSYPQPDSQHPHARTNTSQVLIILDPET